MAEFCLECWRKMNKGRYDNTRYVLSKELDLCEGCGKWKHVIIMERNAYYMWKFRYFILPFKCISLVWRIVLLPYQIYKYKRQKNKKNRL